MAGSGRVNCCGIGFVMCGRLRFCKSGSVRATWLVAGQGARSHLRMTKRSPFRYFKTFPEIIRLAVMLYVRFPLSLRSAEDLLHERGVDVSHEAIRFW